MNSQVFRDLLSLVTSGNDAEQQPKLRLSDETFELAKIVKNVLNIIYGRPFDSLVDLKETGMEIGCFLSKYECDAAQRTFTLALIRSIL